MFRPLLITVSLFTLLAGCGGGSGGSGLPPAGDPLPPGKAVTTPAFESYTTDHNGRDRVRRDLSQAGDAAVLSAFDTSGSGPAGYRNLIAALGPSYAGRVSLEVLAEVSGGGSGPATRLLRLTADQAPFTNEQNGRLVTESGKYYFKGESFAWVTIDNQPMLSGYHARGLESLVLDFDSQTASIDLRTEQSAGSDVRLQLVADNLPFNIRTGAFGGSADITVWSPAAGEMTPIAGSLRGSVGGSPTYANSQHDMITTGLYTGAGNAAPVSGGAAVPVTVDGLWLGRDPNATP